MLGGMKGERLDERRGGRGCVCGEREPGELTLLLTRAQCGPHSSLIAAKNPKVAL